MTQNMSKKSMINKIYKKLPYKGFFSAKAHIFVVVVK